MHLFTLAVLAGIGWSPLASTDTPTTWSQYGGATRNFILPRPAFTPQKPMILWRRTLGQGTSGIVSEGKTLFTMYSEAISNRGNTGQEVIVALDAASGKPRWEHRYPVTRLQGQESYTGEPIRPQATPAIGEGRLYTLGYTGILKCLQATTGKVLWQHDLVQKFQATPVQFGFASSPLLQKGVLLVHVGGKRAALMAFRTKDGSILWESEAAEPSYASPVLVRVGKEDQIVQVTRDAILGAAVQNGQRRWSYPLPTPGLTNVPTPIVLPNQQLLVSGQGLLGTRLLQITRTPQGDQVKEVWQNQRTKFFYSNWVADANAVYGCVEAFTYALALADGKELWRERGLSDGNLVRVGQATIVLRGDGQLAWCQMTPTGLVKGELFPALMGRCWAAPTVLKDTLFMRSDTEIMAIRFSGAG